MAIDTFAGMFTSPEDIRNQRIAEIEAARQRAMTPSGGTLAGLNAMVAGSGYSAGQALGERLGGMFGLKTREEAQAQQLQDMASQVSMEDPDALGAFAKQLNEMGMTKEAIAVLEKRNAVIEQQVRDTQRKREEEDRQRGIAQGKTRTITDTVMRPMSIGSGKNAQVVMVPEQVQYTEVWNEKKKQWERVGEGVAQGASGSSASPYGGITIIDPKTGMATMTQGDPAVNGYQEDLTISP